MRQTNPIIDLEIHRHFYSTCVSSRHSQKCVTLLKLMTELIFFSKVLAHLFLDRFFVEELQTHLMTIPQNTNNFE